MVLYLGCEIYDMHVSHDRLWFITVPECGWVEVSTKDLIAGTHASLKRQIYHSLGIRPYRVRGVPSVGDRVIVAGVVYQNGTWNPFIDFMDHKRDPDDLIPLNIGVWNDYDDILISDDGTCCYMSASNSLSRISLTDSKVQCVLKYESGWISKLVWDRATEVCNSVIYHTTYEGHLSHVQLPVSPKTLSYRLYQHPWLLQDLWLIIAEYMAISIASSHYVMPFHTRHLESCPSGNFISGGLTHSGKLLLIDPTEKTFKCLVESPTFNTITSMAIDNSNQCIYISDKLGIDKIWIHHVSLPSHLFNVPPILKPPP